MEFQVSYKIRLSKEVMDELSKLYDAKTEAEIAQAGAFLIKTGLVSQNTKDLEISEVKVTKIPKELN